MYNGNTATEPTRTPHTFCEGVTQPRTRERRGGLIFFIETSAIADLNPNDRPPVCANYSTVYRKTFDI